MNVRIIETVSEIRSWMRVLGTAENLKGQIILDMIGLQYL